MDRTIPVDRLQMALVNAISDLERAEAELTVRRETRWRENARKLAHYSEPEKPLWIRILLNAGIIEERTTWRS